MISASLTDSSALTCSIWHQTSSSFMPSVFITQRIFFSESRLIAADLPACNLLLSLEMKSPYR